MRGVLGITSAVSMLKSFAWARAEAEKNAVAMNRVERILWNVYP